MGLPAVQLRPFIPGGDPVGPTPGVGGFAAMVPVTEPASAGEPPIAPVMIEGLATGWRKREAFAMSGQRITHARESEPRPRLTVRWKGIGLADAQAVTAFLDVDCKGGQLAFTVRVDLDATTKVRAVGAWQRREVERRIYEVEVPVEVVW